MARLSSRSARGTISFAVALGLWAMSFCLQTSEAQVYDPAADFSASSDPIGPWTYGFSSSLGAPLTVFNNPFKYFSLDFWNGQPGGANTNIQSPWVAHNDAATDQGIPTTFLLAPGELAFAPGPDFAIARWTAPTAGLYSISASFTDPGIDGTVATEDVHVRHNAGSLYDGFIGMNGFGTTAAMMPLPSLMVNAGDTIDFVVGNGSTGPGIFFQDHATLHASIWRLGATVVPEPAAFTFLAGAVVSGVWYMLRPFARRAVQLP